MLFYVENKTFFSITGTDTHHLAEEENSGYEYAQTQSEFIPVFLPVLEGCDIFSKYYNICPTIGYIEAR